MDLLDTKNSILTLDGDKKLQDAVSQKMTNYINDLKQDRSDRTQIYGKRRDYYSGNQSSYSNIFGIIKDTKQKKGHTNQTTNYAGKTTVKIAYGLANNPPHLIINPMDQNDETETIRSQAVQDRIDAVLDDKDNRFWKKTYRRSCFNQATIGDAAIRTFVEKDENGDSQVRIVGQDDMSTIMVGWNGTDSEEFDCVITENYVTPQSIEDDYGIKVNTKELAGIPVSEGTGSWQTDPWGSKSPTLTTNKEPTGKNKNRNVKVQDYDSEDYYAIKIEGQLVQLIIKDDINFPKVKFWTIVKNIPNPPSPWSIADIDYMMDVQTEINDNDNRTSDYIRVGGVQRYVAYNMNDFDPESIKTSSGQVIFVNDPDGKSKFEPLQTNVNNFPSDQYNQRKMLHMYDMGLPKVNYGVSGQDSGRSKAIDYQSSIDLTVFKRDAWELALQDICEKIQIFEHFLHPELDWFNDVNDNFIIRTIDFDWIDILPTSTSDKIVNVANKVNMIGIPLIQAYKELGYRNPEAMLETLKKELKDPDLMIIRSKIWQLSSGLQDINSQTMAAQSNASVTPPTQPSPTITPAQSENKMPMTSAGGTTAFSSASGLLQKTQQNLTAAGK